MQFRHAICNLLVKVRGAILSAYLRSRGCRVGKGLKCKQWPLFRHFPKPGNLIIGDYVNIGWRISFDIAASGTLKLADHVNLTQDIVISAQELVTIGEYTLIAEFVSIRDANHGMKSHQKIALQPSNAASITIGQDVWIAAGCRILKGAKIADGCVIAANAVITGKLATEKNNIYGGIPAMFIGERTKD